MSWLAPARASDARNRPSSSNSEAAARMSGLAAAETTSAERCGDAGAGVIGGGAPGAT